METGKKFDDGKPKLATFYKDFATAYKAIVAVAEYGANKYKEQGEKRNWEDLDNSIPRLKNALFRHLDKYLTGEDTDMESGHPHLAHLIWNACILYELETRKSKEPVPKEIAGF